MIFPHEGMSENVWGVPFLWHKTKVLSGMKYAFKDKTLKVGRHYILEKTNIVWKICLLYRRIDH